MSDDEPTRNISGGDAGGGVSAAFDASDHPDTPLVERVVDRLGERYWQKTYGGRDAFECLVRTVLSQNTSDEASQPAHDSLMARYADGDADLAEALADAHQPDLAETISSAGLYNQKSETIIRLAERVLTEYGGADAFDGFVREADYAEVRAALLDMKGVGPKTADCVLLFAGGRDGVFPVDTHVHRIARRMGFAPPDADHEGVREAIERELPAEKCGFGHTAMIQFGRDFCTARKPACLDDPEACPMADVCAQVGVYPDAGDVVDPADATD
ncbi:endonuclease III domain-containing protein [Halarchaeum nitratireducens]|uniref:Endonuclease III n=1 Tax=Halarchaeum nitratireducens TaxID=489913 RepID=A0A830GB78_9EURY|nr:MULTISPECIES: endonuclease III [Halarchaeum]MBP2251543.1 endonuclease-3 [Halarchaeum solikamskense]GGN14168.1 endonuclease III [Halarchaeum nitratireducens]